MFDSEKKRGLAIMLRALLIDDEPLIVENLSAIIPWQQHQFELVGSAQNGLIALDMVKEYNPDLILCDIRMPKMDTNIPSEVE